MGDEGVDVILFVYMEPVIDQSIETTPPKSKKIGVGFGVMMLRDNRVLLGKRHIDPEKADSELHGEGTWTMPGGKLDFGESFEGGTVRELREETGIVIQESDLEVISLSNDIVHDAHFVTIGLLCKLEPGSGMYEQEPQIMEPDEITQWKWFALDELPTPLFKPSEKVLNNYKEGKFYKN